MITSVYSPEFKQEIKAVETHKNLFPSPADWRDQVFYFLMIDRFNNPEEKPRSEWNKPFDEFQGGKIRGITDKLDYIKDLGATAVWISPPFKNCQFNPKVYHGYGIQNFLTVEPRFGTEEDLIDLVRQAHDKGMFVVFDIVLRHVGDVFEYQLPSGQRSADAPFSQEQYKVFWRDRQGEGKFEDPSEIKNTEDGLWPEELHSNEFFRRKGRNVEGIMYEGDFYTLKELLTINKKVQDVLIKSYQYAIAKFDVDGFRIDTLKFIEPEFARIFANSMREFAIAGGKKNFFTFGEVSDDDNSISQYTGPDSRIHGEMIGVDSALDFPLFKILPEVIKGFKPPVELEKFFFDRKIFQKFRTSSHAEASRFFITFLDNYDQTKRFFYGDGTIMKNQLVAGIGALFTLQGIPCLYYGTEQELSGMGDTDAAVREALWGKPNAFSKNEPIYQEIQKLSLIRDSEPAIKYGRQYFREISGNGTDFGFSRTAPGVIAFARMLNNTEILTIVNTDLEKEWEGDVVVDFILNEVDDIFEILYSNYNSNFAQAKPQQPKFVRLINNATKEGMPFHGDMKVMHAHLHPMEIQILKKPTR